MSVCNAFIPNGYPDYETANQNYSGFTTAAASTLVKATTFCQNEKTCLAKIQTCENCVSTASEKRDVLHCYYGDVEVSGTEYLSYFYIFFGIMITVGFALGVTGAIYGIGKNKNRTGRLYNAGIASAVGAAFPFVPALGIISGSLAIAWKNEG